MTFAKTKTYLGGLVTDTRAERIRIIRVMDKAIYERCGGTKRLFGKWSWDKGTVSEKILLVLTFCITLVVFGTIALIAVGIACFRTVYFFTVERFMSERLR